jgi:hypothetical protein
MTTDPFWICCKNVAIGISSGSDSYPLSVITVIDVIRMEKATQRGVIRLPLLKKYYSIHQINKNEMSGACAMYVGRRGAYTVLVERETTCRT